MKTAKLWSKRFSHARGWEWVLERECRIEDAAQWLVIFQADNADVTFKLSNSKPRMQK